LQINFKRWFPLYTQANLKKEIHMNIVFLKFRRHLCFTLALFISAVLAAPAAAQQGAQRSATPEIVFKQVAPDLYFLFDFESSNAGVLVTDEGALVIDTRQHPRDGQDLLDRIRKITDKPVK
jgi:hypothetical protein